MQQEEVGCIFSHCLGTDGFLRSTAKLCKQLLSQDRNSLSLWCTYARVLRSQRKVEEARQIYRLCCSSFDPQVQLASDIEYVFSEWAELEWLAGHNENLLNILIASVSSEFQIPDGVCACPLAIEVILMDNACKSLGKPSPAMYLKAKQVNI